MFGTIFSVHEMQPPISVDEWQKEDAFSLDCEQSYFFAQITRAKREITRA